MKLFHTTIKSMLTAAVVLVVACEKNEVLENNVDSTENTTSSETAQLVSYEVKSSVSAKEEVQKLIDDLSIEAPICFDLDIEQIGLQLKAYRITYNTVDVSGNPIVLSGDVCYIDGGLSGKRLLGSVSLFHPAFATSEKCCCAYEPYAFIGRAIHNALVVYPHYQGFFAGKQYPVTVSEPLLKARQAIDCEIAALELIKKLDDVDMLPWYVTDNMGISNGTPAALATQYLLEQDKQMQKVNRDYIHLYGTYCCEGPYKYSELITYLADDFPYEDLQDEEDFSQAALVSIIVGTYDTWKGLKDSNGETFFAGIDDVKGYFNPTLFTRTDLIEDGVVVNDVVEYFREGKLDHISDIFKNAGLSSREMINPAFFKEDGKFDEDNPMVKALYSAMAQNEVITKDWNPKAPLVMTHSTADELCPYDHTIKIYYSLSKYGLNTNVDFKTIVYLTHTKANMFYAICDIIPKKHPTE